MNWDLTTYAQRSCYRPMSIALELASLFAIATVSIGVPGPICFIFAAGFWIILTVITFHRLRNGAFSGAWVWLMIIQFGIGPTWHLPDHLTFNLVGWLVGSVPVILGWIAPTNASEIDNEMSA